MYFPDRGIEELGDRRGEDQVMLVWLAAEDVGRRVVICWRRPGEKNGKNGEETADVLGVLEAADAASFRVRKVSGELVTIPRDRALAGKIVPAVPCREHRGPGSPGAGESPPAVRDNRSSPHLGSAA